MWGNISLPDGGYKQKYSNAFDDFYDDLPGEQERQTVQDLIRSFNSLDDESSGSDYFKSKMKPIKLEEFYGKESYGSKDSFFKTKILPPHGKAFPQEPDDQIKILKPISFEIEEIASSSVIKPQPSHGSPCCEESLDGNVSEEFGMDF